MINFLGKRPGLTIMLLTVTALSSCARHKPPEGPGRPEMNKDRVMEQWDMNRDGIITCVDADLKKKQLFGRTDLDGNEMLDIDEFKQAPWSNPAFAAEHLSLYDKNHNKQISLEEFINHPDSKFESIDLNHDCIISDKEISAMLSRKPGQGMRGGKGQHNGPPGGKRNRQ